MPGCSLSTKLGGVPHRYGLAVHQALQRSHHRSSPQEKLHQDTMARVTDQEGGRSLENQAVGADVVEHVVLIKQHCPAPPTSSL